MMQVLLPGEILQGAVPHAIQAREQKNFLIGWNQAIAKRKE